ncbi:histidine kinase [Roseateles amylovorans]|uniref:Histidine kinase n=1 Tax=Roseateles amylovorans TaxID=2978473 RepID=A0ABY6AXX0_9BURK|nr:histidine kinase [Roseateles amylovorans]UXH77817.1 histidine kinase [Roseateles amylovorans]
MSAAVGDLAALPTPQGALSHLWRSWRSLRAEELTWFALMAVFYGLIDLGAIAYVLDDPRWPQALARQLLTPLLVGMVLMLAWLPANRSAPDHPWRQARLAAATLIGSFLGIWLYVQLVPLVNLPSVADLARARKGEAGYESGQLAVFIGECLSVFVPSLLSVSLYELVLRQRRTRAQLQQLLQAQSALQRHAMASRLAALQAQVEPQFLFDTLVDIEHAYANAEPDASSQMERLIRHLRVALPRLRDQGGTLESEAMLLDSYLAVVAGRQRRALTLELHWPPELSSAPLPPMVLLPLAQLMLRHAHPLPGHARLSAERDATRRLRLRLAFDRGGLCREDEALRALSDRLDSLAGGPARLHCRSQADETEFTLELPS